MTPPRSVPQVLQASRSLSSLQLVVLALLVVEGSLTCLAAVGYAAWLLSRVARHRAALYTVFLTVPNNCLRMLGSKSISLEDDEEGSQDGGARGSRAARARPCSARLQERDLEGSSARRVLCAGRCLRGEG